MLALVLRSRTRQKGSQFPAVVLPALVMPGFEHGEGTILDVRIRQCRDQIVSLPFVLIIHLLQDGSKGLYERMILGQCRFYRLTNPLCSHGTQRSSPLCGEISAMSVGKTTDAMDSTRFGISFRTTLQR